MCVRQVERAQSAQPSAQGGRPLASVARSPPPQLRRARFQDHRSLCLLPRGCRDAVCPSRPGLRLQRVGGGADPLPLGSYWVLSGHSLQFSSAQSLSRVRLCDPWTAAHQASLFITNSRSLPKLMSTESVMPSNHLILCRPLLLLPSTWPSIRVFSSESALHMKWPKYWSFSLSISPSNEHPRLILQNGLVGSPCSPRDSQESSPTPQFKSINSSVLSFLHSPYIGPILRP